MLLETNACMCLYLQCTLCWRCFHVPASDLTWKRSGHLRVRRTPEVKQCQIYYLTVRNQYVSQYHPFSATYNLDRILSFLKVYFFKSS